MTRIYLTGGTIGLALLTWVAWTESLVVVLRGGEIFPAPVEIAQWILPVVTFLVGWSAWGHPPTWLRWITAPAAAGVWLQGVRHLLGVDSLVLVGLRWCWIVKDSVLVGQKAVLEKAYLDELTRLFNGDIPAGVSLTPAEPHPEALLWGDLTTLGTSRALHEHSTWLVKTLPPVPVPDLPTWADWLAQWGPTLVGAVVVVGGAALFWYHHGAIDHLDQSYKAVGESVASIAQGVAHTIKKVNQVDHNGLLRFQHLTKRVSESVLHGSRNDAALSFLYQVMITLAGGGRAGEIDPNCSPEDLAQKISLALVQQAIRVFQRLYFVRPGEKDNNNNNDDDDE